MAMNAKNSTRRPDRRLAKTRRAILEAGESLFACRSRDAVTIDELIDAADVSRASFYNHFKDKDDLFRSLVEEFREENSLAVAAANRMQIRASDRIARAFYVNCRYAVVQRGRAALLREYFLDLTTHHSDNVPLFARNLHHDVEEGVAMEEFHDLRVEVGVMLIVGITNTAIETILGGGGRMDQHLIGELAAGLLRSLGVHWDYAKSIVAAAAADIPLDAAETTAIAI